MTNLLFHQLGQPVMAGDQSVKSVLTSQPAAIVRPLPGLTILRSALSEAQQLQVASDIVLSGCLAEVEAEEGEEVEPEKTEVKEEAEEVAGTGSHGSGRTKGLPNQAMFFGDLPPWTLRLIKLLPLSELLPPELASRSPSFDQTIVNLYRPGEGITSHVDLARFQDGIVSVSVGGPAVMHFTRCSNDPWVTANRGENCAGSSGGAGGGGSCSDCCGRSAEGGDLRERVDAADGGGGEGDGDGGSKAEAAAVVEAQPPQPEKQRKRQECNESGGGGGIDGDGNGGGAGSTTNRCASQRQDAGVWWCGPDHLCVLLQGGDLVGMAGEARFGWEHGIRAVVSELWGEVGCSRCAAAAAATAAAATAGAPAVPVAPAAACRGTQQVEDACQGYRPAGYWTGGLSSGTGTVCQSVTAAEGRQLKVLWGCPGWVFPLEQSEEEEKGFRKEEEEEDFRKEEEEEEERLAILRWRRPDEWRKKKQLSEAAVQMWGSRFPTLHRGGRSV
ncbi:hypothetical protein VOLCADRAFT_89333 [Volvox carteri f. nagariensis]|uniref:Alpha-ketoglutarate-dependent dioxygenase AlkB-like domain-containing protein n=1 Tax=Volvox carteri f. nagariensis TaxID=3068 RepID=D8TRF6_VOLCA|nr:uncharacterized protein VOLCADRAFT_89333 [Volvox carteri f. nagariensis]EFJ49884.1 hypothetical protein VOLCADRAFT_89333 [Volvox carteri f. nagariensis]|eukprot:XP_002948949.1 hypothetical protein VOLCADRAFT_89333 [Volvox carteri f. nagariensis]